MNKEKIFIKNRKGMKISLLLEISDNQKGIVFIVHGYTGFKEQEHIKTFAESFIEKGYTSIRLDTTNSINESDGKNEDGTATTYYEDLEDVINWAKDQEWYEEPFILVGHSLGGLVVGLYAEKYPDKIKAIAPISTVVSGKLSREKLKEDGELEKWKKIGWQERISKTRKIVKRIPWSYQLDKEKYDLLENAYKLKMPVLMIVGGEDNSTPVKHQEILFKQIPGKKEIHIIAGAPHTFKEKKHLKEIKKIFDRWLKKLK
jgi:alpha-beta hydrolase superfamily lysophospholipase